MSIPTVIYRQKKILCSLADNPTFPTTNQTKSTAYNIMRHCPHGGYPKRHISNSARYDTWMCREGPDVMRSQLLIQVHRGQICGPLARFIRDIARVMDESQLENEKVRKTEKRMDAYEWVPWKSSILKASFSEVNELVQMIRPSPEMERRSSSSRI